MYVRLDLKLEEVGMLAHAAELRPLAGKGSPCEVLRMVEMAFTPAVTGAWTPDFSQDMNMEPPTHVPYPENSDAFPDVLCTELTADEFEALWEQARARYQEL